MQKQQAIASSHRMLEIEKEKKIVTSKRILVIDDEDDILTLVQTCLEIMGGWQVITAHSGCEDLDLAQDHQPDAILLDVMTPTEDGLSTLTNSNLIQ